MAEHKSLAYIGLGSNLGDRRAFLSAAVARISEWDYVHSFRCSSVYETLAIGCDGVDLTQPTFLNAVMEVVVSIEPESLLKGLLDVEQQLGRLRKAEERWAARVIDLDLLAYDQLVCESSLLTLPHPRMQERLFVLKPFSELNPDWMHPLQGLRICELLEALELQTAFETEFNPVLIGALSSDE